MNLPYVIATALTVSVDALVAGFSMSLNKRKSLLLPMTVAFVTYLLCLAAGLAGNALREVLQGYVKYTGAAILVCLGLNALLKKESPTPTDTAFSQCLAMGFGVGADGAVASLTLVMQGSGDVVFTPILFAVTHFAAVFAGGCLAKTAKAQHVNLFSAAMFFLLAALKLLDI